MATDLINTIREPLLRIIRVIQAEPDPGPDFPSYWVQAMREADELPITLAIAVRAHD